MRIARARRTVKAALATQAAFLVHSSSCCPLTLWRCLPCALSASLLQSSLFFTPPTEAFKFHGRSLSSFKITTLYHPALWRNDQVYFRCTFFPRHRCGLDFPSSSESRGKQKHSIFPDISSRNSRLELYSSTSPARNKENSSINRSGVSSVETFTEGTMTFHHLPSVGSTQDEARRLLRGELLLGGPVDVDVDGATASTTTAATIIPNNRYFAVSASQQHSGRGTSGRTWLGAPGNTFVTICIPMDLIPVTVTLLPLKVGTIVANRIQTILQARDDGDEHLETNTSSTAAATRVTVKWPNDVLINGCKIAGTLVENEIDKDGTAWFLVGVGVNMKHAPSIEQTGRDRGRQSTCLMDYRPSFIKSDDGIKEAQEMARGITRDLCGWIDECRGGKLDKDLASEVIVRQWEKFAEFGKEARLRDVPGYEAVIPVGIEKDGRLRVLGRDGKERMLVSDYLY